MIQVFVAILAIFAAVSITGDGARPAAAEGIEVRTNTASSRFPDGITFQLFTASTAEIRSVRLRSRVLPDRPMVFSRPQCTTGTAINCNATLGNTANNYMVPGADVLYSWEIEDATGAKLETPEAKVTYTDSRFRWESQSEGNITVYYYFGDPNSVSASLRTARETLDSIGRLVGRQVDFPIKVWVYQTASDMQPAVASRRQSGPNSSVRTLGEVGAADTALVSRDTDFLNIVRHELAHVVTNYAVADHIADIPVWINEGISTYSQRELLPDEAQALQLALRRNAILPITSLTASARGTSDQVSLFYGQSGSLVAYLVQTHGQEKFTQFIRAMKNDTTDGAMKTAYGFDQLGLENAWRKSVGLPEVTGGTGQSTGPAAQPTIVPFGSTGSSSPAESTPVGNQTGTSSTTNTADDSSSSSSMPLIAGGVIVALLVAGGAGAYFLRRSKAPSPPPPPPVA